MKILYWFLATFWLYSATWRTFMPIKRTMTINLNDNEMSILEDICDKKGLSKTALVRQALRLYQTLDARTEGGDRLYLENPISKEKSELMVL